MKRKARKHFAFVEAKRRKISSGNAGKFTISKKSIFAAILQHTHQIMTRSATLLSDLETAKAAGEKKFAVLIDPDKLRMGNTEEIIGKAVEAGVDYFFIGGSLIVNNMLDECLKDIKKHSDIPTILFPGNNFQLSFHADAILFLCLISGRNPELLIGNHVLAAPYLKVSPLQILPTGYILVDGGIDTTVRYISNTNPVPHAKNDIALCTALAGEMLGQRLIFMDAGSGAKTPVSTEMIETVSSAVGVPLIVGGGISTPEKAAANVRAGADVVVVGNAIEKDPGLMRELSAAVHG